MKVMTDKLIQTCGACPSQWDGITDDGRNVYVRYRWGYLSVRVALEQGESGDAVGGEEILGEQLGDGLDGVLSQESLVLLLQRHGLAADENAAKSQAEIELEEKATWRR